MNADESARRKWISAVVDRRYRRRRWMFAPLFGGCLLSLAATSPNDQVFERVVKQARVAATLPYQPKEMSLPEVLRELNYDTCRMITFRSGPRRPRTFRLSGDRISPISNCVPVSRAPSDVP
jgi:hypothetical protein